MNINIYERDLVSMNDDALDNQIKGKAAGPDGIDMEADIYGGHRLRSHLCLLFNACISHGYLAHAVLDCVILPLIKNKGDLNDADYYRAIAISDSISKLLEACILDNIKSFADVDKYQFGFKPEHFTSLFTSILKRTIDYYTSRSSHVSLALWT